MPPRGNRPNQPPLADLLARLHEVVQAQVAALDRDDVDGVEQLAPERERLVAALDGYRAADLRAEDRALLEQIGALDQRLLASARQSLDQANLELRSIFRGHGALQKYQRRGQALIGHLGSLDVAR